MSSEQPLDPRAMERFHAQLAEFLLDPDVVAVGGREAPGDSPRQEGEDAWMFHVADEALEREDGPAPPPSERRLESGWLWRVASVATIGGIFVLVSVTRGDPSSAFWPSMIVGSAGVMSGSVMLAQSVRQVAARRRATSGPRRFHIDHVPMRLRVYLTFAASAAVALGAVLSLRPSTEPRLPDRSPGLGVNGSQRGDVPDQTASRSSSHRAKRRDSKAEGDGEARLLAEAPSTKANGGVPSPVTFKRQQTSTKTKALASESGRPRVGATGSAGPDADESTHATSAQSDPTLQALSVARAGALMGTRRPSQGQTYTSAKTTIASSGTDGTPPAANASAGDVSADAPASGPEVDQPGR